MFKVNELIKVLKGKLISGLQRSSVSGISIDSRTIVPGVGFLAIKGNNFDGHDFIEEVIKKGCRVIIAEAGKVSLERLGRISQDRKIVLITVKDTVLALGQLAAYNRKRYNIPVIAITGSSGKTTAKEMISAVLSAKFRVLKNEGTKNNHIGLPLTLLKLNSEFDIVVLEVGTNHFGEVEYLAKIASPDIGVITNVGPAHLEHFKSLAGVFKEKYSLIRNLQKPGIVVLNADDPFLNKKLAKIDPKIFTLGFGINNLCDFLATDIRLRGNKQEFLVNQRSGFILNIPGDHNIYNALSAISLGRVFGVEDKDIAASLAKFESPKGRFQFVEMNDLRFIDDTYNSNPLSLTQALNALDNFTVSGRKILVMGDMLELGEHKEAYHSQAGVKAAGICDCLVAVGELSQFAAKAALEAGFDLSNLFTCKSSQEAREILFKKISPKDDDIILVKGSRCMKMEEVFKK